MEAFNGCNNDVKILYGDNTYTIEQFKKVCQKMSVNFQANFDENKRIVSFWKIKKFDLVKVKAEEYIECDLKYIIEHLGNRVYFLLPGWFENVFLGNLVEIFYDGKEYSDINEINKIFKDQRIRFFYKSGKGLVILFPIQDKYGQLKKVFICPYDDNIIDRIKETAGLLKISGISLRREFIRFCEMKICFYEPKI